MISTTVCLSIDPEDEGSNVIPKPVPVEAAGREVPPPKAEPDVVPNSEVTNDEINMDGSVIDPASPVDSEPAFGDMSSLNPPATILIEPSTDPIDVGTAFLFEKVTAFPPAETTGTGFLGSKTVSTTLFGDTTVDAVDDANADLTDAANDASFRPVLNPVPMIVAPIGAGVFAVNEPVFNDNCLLEPPAPWLELPTAVLSISVQDGVVEIKEEDDPNGESAPTLEIVAELAPGLKQTEMEQDLPSALPDENPFVSELGRLLVVGFPSKPRVLSKLLAAKVTEILSTDTSVACGQISWPA